MIIESNKAKLTENDLFFFSQSFGSNPALRTIHFPTGEILIDCLVTKDAAEIIITALNNLVVIAAVGKSVNPGWLAKTFINSLKKNQK